jgi:hypothetical protein
MCLGGEIPRQQHMKSLASQTSSQFGAQTLNTETETTEINTINATFLDTGERFETLGSDPITMQLNPLPDSTPIQMLQRLYPVKTYTLPTTQAVSLTTPWQVLNPIALLSGFSLNALILSQYAFFRADVELEFRAQTNQFYSGALQISQSPRNAGSTDQATMSLAARSWLKPVVMDLQKQDTVKIALPWLDPRRYVRITSFDPDWFIFLDVVAPLRAASATAPSSIQINVYGRFVNPQVVFPYINTTRQIKQGKLEPEYQANPSSTVSYASMVRKPRAHRVVVNRIVSKSNPVHEARTRSRPEPHSVPSTVSHTLAQGAYAMGDLISAVQPLLRLAPAIAALFDKPNVDAPASRMLDQNEVNMPSADCPDQAIPLAMYRTSYLATGDTLLPDGKPWTWLDIATTPSLCHTGTLTTSTSITMQLMSRGTPLDFVLSNHLYAHYSLRVKIFFFTSSFISGRVQIIWTPSVLSPTVSTTVADTISRTIDVKGSVTDEFTLPWVWPNDYYRVNYGTNVFPYTLMIAMAGPISTPDAAADANIDYVIYTAASADAQFSQLGMPQRFVYPTTDPEFQCDVQQCFMSSFEPFVAGCSIFTDQHTCMSETSQHVTDCLKRYVGTAYITDTLYGSNACSGEYLPYPGTVQAQVMSCFLFQRGGVNYKGSYGQQIPAASLTPPPFFTMEVHFPRPAFPTAVVNNIGNSFGEAVVRHNSSANEICFSLPYFYQTPFRCQKIPTGYETFDSNVAILATNQRSDTTIYPPTLYTAARDDYQVGYLYPPLPLSLSLPQAQKRLEPKVANPRSVGQFTVI